MTELETLLGTQVMRQGLELKVLHALLKSGGACVVNPDWINWATCLHVYVEGGGDYRLVVDCLVMELEDAGEEAASAVIQDTARWCSGNEYHIAILLDKQVRKAA